jgi:hypothetical protein
MKPLDGKYQTATQVKGLSPEIINIKEADSVHVLEGGKKDFAMVRSHSLFRGLRPWYVIEWILQELGRPILFLSNQISGNDLKRKESGDDSMGVGLTHSRGVTGVMPCEFQNKKHSKGSAVICKGKGKHGKHKEAVKPCRRN